MHGAADRGAVAALVPRRQLEVAAVLREAGIARAAPRRRARRASVVAPTNAAPRALRERGVRARPPTRRGRDPGASGSAPGAARRRRAPAVGRRRTPASCAAFHSSSACVQRRAFDGREVARLAVHRHDEVIAGARARDVEQPQLLVEVHLLVDRLVQLEVRGLHALRQLHLVAAVGREQHLHAARRRDGRGRRAGTDHDRELETFRAVDRHDANRVVVGLGQHRLDDPRALGTLQRRPREVVAQRAALRRRRTPAPGRRRSARAARRRGTGLPSAPTSSTRRSRTMRSSSSLGVAHSARRVQGRARYASASATGWSAGTASGGATPEVPAPAVLDMERVEVVVAAAEERRPQRAHERELVGGIVDRAQRRDADRGPRGVAVDQRARLGAVRHPHLLEGALEKAEGRTRRKQNADVAETRGAPCTRVAIEHLRLVGEHTTDRRRDVLGLAGAQLVGVRPVVVRVDPEQGDLTVTAIGAARSSSARYSGCDPGCGAISSANTALIHSRTRGAVRKLHVRCSGAGSANASAAARNVAMSARRNR